MININIDIIIPEIKFQESIQVGSLSNAQELVWAYVMEDVRSNLLKKVKLNDVIKEKFNESRALYMEKRNG